MVIVVDRIYLYKIQSCILIHAKAPEYIRLNDSLNVRDHMRNSFCVRTLPFNFNRTHPLSLFRPVCILIVFYMNFSVFLFEIHLFRSLMCYGCLMRMFTVQHYANFRFLQWCSTAAACMCHTRDMEYATNFPHQLIVIFIRRYYGVCVIEESRK